MSDPLPSQQQVLTHPSRSRVILRLVYVFAALLILEGSFWFTADLRRFVPPDDGPFYERLMLTLCTAAGPLRLAWQSMERSQTLSKDRLSSIAFALFLLGAIAVSILGRSHLFWRALGYTAILLWFGFGCMMTSLRIT